MKVNAEIIKTALMSYYRYQRQMVCCDEVSCLIQRESCDVLVDSLKAFYDVEVKITKYDLWKGEAVKQKHIEYTKISSAPGYRKWRCPNYFMICVPTSLLEEATKWADQTNNKYGIIEFDEEFWERKCKRKQLWKIESLIKIVRSPRKLHHNYSCRLKELLIRRLSSAYTSKRQNDLKKQLTAIIE